MRIFLIRHADPDYALDSITLQGHREAKALAVRMQSIGLDRIFCSPMGRAKATMRYTADRLKIEPVIEDWTAEMSTLRFEGEKGSTLMAWDINGHQLRAMEPAPNLENWHTYPPLDVPEFKEAIDAVFDASDQFMAKLGYRRQGTHYQVTRPGNEEKVALFCHGGFGLTWLSHLLRIPLPQMWSSFFLWPSSVTTILMDERSKGIATPRCIGLSDVSHLYATGLQPQPRGIKANTR
ncbi:MAG: histidine phosphatase family protein [Phycisphaeraceae bacterium]|nr:histidine phosphatase family protein [Phycisphaeraceae bacterium]